MEATIDVVGPSGDTVRIAGDGAGSEGIWLLSEVEGLVDPVSEAVTKPLASRPGARLLASRLVERSLVFKVGIDNTDGRWFERDNRWRKLWSFGGYTELVVTAEDGRRTLRCRLEEITVDTTYDPRVNGMTDVTMSVVADDPLFYAADEVAEVSSGGDGVVALHNATGRPVYPRFVLAVDGLADTGVPVSIEVDGQALVLPAPERSSFRWVVDTDPSSRQIMDADGYPVWQRMNGRRFTMTVPADGWVRSLRVSSEGSGEFSYTVQARLAQAYERPWGDV